MFKVVFSVLAAFVVTTSVCSAADLDPVDYYSLSPVQSLSSTVNSSLDYAVQPLSATSWDTTDQTNLSWIRNAFYNPNSGYVSNSLLGWVKKLADNSVSLSGLISDVDSLNSGLVGTSGSVLWYAREIFNNTETFDDYFAYLRNLTSLQTMEYNLDYIEEDTGNILNGVLSSGFVLSDIFDDLSSLSNYIENTYNFNVGFASLDGGYVHGYTYSSTLANMFMNSSASLWVDGANGTSGQLTLYTLVKRLNQVLASDDDVSLANSQKDNREEIESFFLNGSSGPTSLGASDFVDFADVGGTIKDSLSLDGNATIGSFTSGLAAADSAGQGWFSEETRSQLDAVSSTVTYSLRDSDPYNMAGWEDRYYWLLGDDE